MSNTRKARSSKICLDLRSATAPLGRGFAFGGTDLEKNHFEQHYVARVGWLRAAVLGANDGIVSTASLIVGVAAASGRAAAAPSAPAPSFADFPFFPCLK